MLYYNLGTVHPPTYNKEMNILLLAKRNYYSVSIYVCKNNKNL